MERVAEPLRQMGAKIETTDGHAPLTVEGSDSLQGITYRAARRERPGEVGDSARRPQRREPDDRRRAEARRAITPELMLQAAGVAVRRRPAGVTVEPAGALRLGEVDVPGDFSSAAPLLAAAAIVPGSELTIHDVGLNPRRNGLLDVLDRMGAHVTVFNKHRVARRARGRRDDQIHRSRRVEVKADEVPLLVDELPLVALLASHARGDSIVRGAEELRLKETDRIEAVTDGLRALGARIRSRPDGWIVTGVPRRLREAGSTLAATTGSRCSEPSRALVQGRRRHSRRRDGRYKLPGFYDLLESVVRR